MTGAGSFLEEGWGLAVVWLRNLKDDIWMVGERGVLWGSHVGCYSRPFVPRFKSGDNRVIPALYRTSYYAGKLFQAVIPPFYSSPLSARGIVQAS